MRALVVYESMFGNTAAVATAIGAGLADAGLDVEVVEVGAAPPAPGGDVGLLVVGAPTHALSLPRPETRASAAEQATAPLVSTGAGLRAWLEALPRGRGPVAAFDTHIDKPIPGTASGAALKRLRRRGYRPVVPAASFRVADVAGPLLPGELDRARSWAVSLAAACLASVR